MDNTNSNPSLDRAKQLGEKPIFSLLCKFSIPAIIGMIVNAIYNVVDRIFVGQAVGDEALAALSFSFPITTAIFAIAMLVGLGGTSLVAISLGENNRERAEKILNNVFVLAILFELIITIVGLLFLEPILTLFGTPGGAIMDYAIRYMQIVLAGSIFQGLSFALNAIIRSEGNPKAAMSTMLIGAVVNIVLDWLLTMVIALSVEGAAIATIAGQFVSTMWLIYYYTIKGSSLKLRIKYFKVDFRALKKIVTIGLAPAMVQVVMALINISYNNQLMRLGELELGLGKGQIAVSAYAVFNSAVTLAIMPIFGLNQGVQPIVGFNYGAKKMDRVKLAMKYGMICATVILIIGALIIQLFPQQIVRMFNDNPDLINIGVMALRINTLGIPLVGIQVLSANYFQYIGKAKPAMLLSLTRQFFFLLPAIYI